MACDRLEGLFVLTRLFRGSCYTNSAYRFQTVASYRLVSKCTWNSNNLGEGAMYPFKRSFSPPCNSLYLLETPQYRICNCCVGKLGRQCASKWLENNVGSVCFQVEVTWRTTFMPVVATVTINWSFGYAPPETTDAVTTSIFQYFHFTLNLIQSYIMVREDSSLFDPPPPIR